MPHSPSSTQDIELIAILAFTFLAEDDRRLDGLLALAGLDIDACRALLEARTPAFLGHVMGYLMSDEAWAKAFAQRHSFTPEDLHGAASHFGHGGLMN